MNNFKIFYSNNKSLIKNCLKGLGFSAGAIITGFIAYYLRFRKELNSEEISEENDDKKEITVENLVKIVDKIKNQIIYILVGYYDLNHKYDPSEYLKKEDVLVENVKNETKLSEYSTNKNYQRDVMPELLNRELKQISQFHLKPEEYYELLRKHSDNETIKRDAKLISDFLKYYGNDQLFKINFGEAIDKNYLKIISNIYYLNIRKTQKDLKKNYIDEGYVFNDEDSKSKKFNELYKHHLKSTRKEVIEFFKVGSENSVLSVKIMLRIYPYYNSKYHPLRLSYEKINNEVNLVIKKIQNEGYIEELCNDSHPEAVNSPVDRLIDFSHLLSTRAASNLSEDRNRQVHKRYEQVYQNKDIVDDDDLE